MTEYQDATVPNKQYAEVKVMPGLDRACPTCKAKPGDPCRTPKEKRHTSIHQARLRR